MISTPSSSFFFRIFFILSISIAFLVLILFGYFHALRMPTHGLSLDTSLSVIEIEPRSSASLAGFQTGDKIIKINGVPAEAGDRIAAEGRRIDIGESTIYTIERERGQILDLTLQWAPPDASRKAIVTLNCLLSLVMLITACITTIRRPGFPTSWLFFTLCLFYIFFRMDHPRWQGEYFARLYQTMYMLGFFMVPSLFAHFCCWFPKKSLFFHEKKTRMQWFYIASIILFVPAAAFNWIHYADFEAASLITKIVLYQGFLLWSAFLITGSLTMIRSFLRIRSRILSRRCSLVFYSLIVAISPYLISGIVVKTWTESFSFDMVTLLLFMPVPAFIAWTIDYGEDKDEGIPWILQNILKQKEKSF